eukprot:TRINITY_DN8743_c0_g1_i4.p1 TRINITY_DN8743_c0_g1~~TRINITY_DN8743_c0_g1_i4.p1  ORF type:complete len:2119 (-),score=526.12 TRINITY_DN8743_c0_g1_i4:35-6391(-)
MDPPSTNGEDHQREEDEKHTADVPSFPESQIAEEITERKLSFDSAGQWQRSRPSTHGNDRPSRFNLLARRTLREESRPAVMSQLKVICYVGEISSIVNIRFDLQRSVDALMMKVLSRFPVDDQTKYIITAGGSVLDESKPIIAYEDLLERANFNLELKRKASFYKVAPMMTPPSEAINNSRRLTAGNISMNTAVIEATKRGDKEKLTGMIKQSKDLLRITDLNDQTLLHLACYHGHENLVTYFLKQKLDPMATDLHLWTPLHCAASNGYVKIMDVLLKEDVDVNAKTDENTTALHYLVKSTWSEEFSEQIFLTLIGKSADINVENNQGETPLHKASLVGNLEMVKLLLDHSADPNIKNKHGETPLHFAVRGGFLEISKLLLRNCANASISGEHGTPKAIAESLNNAELVELLSGELAAMNEKFQRYVARERERRVQLESSTSVLKEALKIEVEAHAEAKLKRDELEKKMKEENRKRILAEDELVNKTRQHNAMKEILESDGKSKNTFKMQLANMQEENQALQSIIVGYSRDISELTKSNHEKQLIHSELEDTKQKLRKEENLRLLLEKKLEEKAASSPEISLKASPEKPQIDLPYRSRLEIHNGVCRELKHFMALSAGRDWSTEYVYMPAGEEKKDVPHTEDYESATRPFRMKKLAELQSTFCVALEPDYQCEFAEPFRRIIRSGKVIGMEDGFPSGYSLFLFNDLILLTEFNEKDSRHYFHDVIPIDHCNVGDSRDAGEKNEFDLIRVDTKFVYQLRAESPEEKDIWIRDIRGCIAGLPHLPSQNVDRTAEKEAKSNSAAPSKRTDIFKSFKLAASINVVAVLKNVETKQLALLDLSKANLKVKGAALVAGAIQHNRSVKTLLLPQNGLEDKGLVAVIASLKDNNTLTSLVLSDNMLQSVGPCISDYLRRNTSLTELDLSNNTISDASLIATALQVNTTMRKLNLTDNALNDQAILSFAGVVRTSHSISELYLDNNPTTVKGEAFLEEALREVRGSSIQVLTIKHVAFRDSIASILKTNRDRFARSKKPSSSVYNECVFEIDKQSEVSAEILDLGFFHLSKVNLNSLHYGLTLKMLYLDHCSLYCVPDFVASLSQLKKLYLMRNRISSIPGNVFAELPQIEELDLSENSIAGFPPEIANLKHLRTLAVANNGLASLPDEICSVVSLTKLLLQGNSLYNLPSKISSLSNLTELNLFGNPMAPPLRRVYQAFGSRTKELDLSGQNIQELPAEIGILKSLLQLKLSNNKLKYLPPQIGDLKGLIKLDISGNPLVELPPQLANLPLDSLEVANTKLTIPEVVLENLPLLKTQLEQQKLATEPFRRIKLMLLGRENVGKTSIRHCLQARNAKELTKIKKLPNLSTDGIELEDWSPEGTFRPFSFQFWDFAGQDVYYITHQFFINTRAIYLVIFSLKDSPEELSKIDYWLQSINQRAGGEVPIVLIGTHADEVREGEIEQIHSYITEKYLLKSSSIKHFLTVSCKTRKGMSTLQDILVQLVDDLPYLETLYPRSFRQLEQLILDQRPLRTPPVISISELRDWCASCDIAAEEERNAIKLMHDLGVILHFSEPRTLENLVIIDPQWMTRLMATLVTTKPNFVKNGILLSSDLAQIWKSAEFPESHRQALLSLLERFEIAFSLPSVPTAPNQRIFIPCLVQTERPADVTEGNWPFAVERMHAFEFLPFGFFSRLVVRLMYFMEVKSFWKDGILFVVESGECLIEYVPKSLQLRIKVRGSEIKVTSSLRFVVENTAVLLKGWYATQRKQYIPCNCDRCARFNYEERTMFVVEGCESVAAAACKTGKAVVTCPSLDDKLAQAHEIPREMRGTVEVPLDRLAPDLMMADLGHLKIPSEELTFDEVIAQGAFGAVWKGVYQGNLVAIKKQLDTFSVDEAIPMYREFRREVWLSSTLVHPNIVSMVAFCTSPCCAVLEYVPNGNLLKFLRDAEREISFAFKIKIAINVAEALKFMHTRSPKVIHRDLKSPNILMVSFNERAELVCKVGDFGESIAVATEATGRDNLANPLWLSPEMMKQLPFNEKTDVFSFAMVMIELLTRKLPYDEHEISRSSFRAQFEDQIIKGLRPTIPSDTPEIFAKLIRDCWQHDQDRRPDFATILSTLLSLISY